MKPFASLRLSSISIIQMLWSVQAGAVPWR